MKNTIKKQLMQMFIMGFSGKNYLSEKYFCKSYETGLGGVIFFSENFSTVQNLKETILNLKKNSHIPLFFSIDQEGGLVERTISLDYKNNYLTQKAVSRLCSNDINLHYDILCKELYYLGFNMNFAPCIDVDTNPDSPVIGLRAFSADTDTVIDCSKIILKAMKENNIISVAKHFPGHGDCNIDTHKNMAHLSGDFSEFYNTHTICFKEAIDNNVDCIMVAHINCQFFNKFEKTIYPATLSKSVISYLKNELNFKGLIISDDMVMGGVSNYFSLKESILKGIFSGIEMFIFRNSTKELWDSIDEISKQALLNIELKNIIEANYKKILEFKKKKLYSKNKIIDFDYKETQEIIDKLANKTLKIFNQHEIQNFSNKEKIYVLRFNPNDIFNLSFDNYSIKDDLKEFNIEEIYYPINPDEHTIENITKNINTKYPMIYIVYNAHQNIGQQNLLNKIKNQKIIISSGNDYEINVLGKKDLIISTACPKPTALSSSAKLAINFIIKNSD